MSQQFHRNPPFQIGIIGAGLCDESTAAQAETVGRNVARRGCILLSGGWNGVMEAVKLFFERLES